jgi:hypothetical protein
MASISEVWTDGLSVEQRRHVALSVEGRPERIKWMWNYSSTRSGIANRISCYKNITNRNRQQMSTIWWHNRPYHISMSNIGKRTTHKQTWEWVHSTALQHMQGNMGNIRQSSLVWTCTKISRTSHEGKLTILWNQQVQSDRTIPNDKPDTIICYNEEGTYLLTLNLLAPTTVGVRINP